MNGKSTLGIDLEGTLADAVSSWLALVKQRHGIEARKEEFRGHMLDHPNLKLISHEQYTEMFRDIWADWHTINLEDPDEPAVLKRLKERYNIYILTASLGQREQIESWMNKNGLPFDKIVKTEVGRKTLPKVDIYVDDFFDVLKDAVSEGKKGIMLWQTWNDKRASKANELGIPIAKNWKGVEQLLSGSSFSED